MNVNVGFLGINFFKVTVLMLIITKLIIKKNQLNFLNSQTLNLFWMKLQKPRKDKHL